MGESVDTNSQTDDNAQAQPSEEVASFEYLDSNYEYILPSVHGVIQSIDDNDLRWKMEYLLNDYRRLWHRRHYVESQQGDTLLSEIKIWTEDKINAAMPPIEETTNSVKEKEDRIRGHLEKLLVSNFQVFQKNLFKLKEEFAKVSAKLTSELMAEPSFDRSFNLQAALARVQLVSPDTDYTITAESVDDLIKEIEALETLVEELLPRLDQTFKADSEVCEKINRAKEDLEETQSSREQEFQREKLETDWSMTQLIFIDKLFACAETIDSQLKYQLSTETRDSIIAKESINEYERLLCVEKLNSNTINVDASKTNRKISLQALAKHPAVINFASAVLSALNESRDTYLDLSRDAFKRLSFEQRDLQTPATHAMMGICPDDDIETDFKKTVCQAHDEAAYPSVIHSMFDILARMLKEFSRLMNIQRLRDVQMSTLAQNINIASLNAASQIAEACNSTSNDIISPKDSRCSTCPGQKTTKHVCLAPLKKTPSKAVVGAKKSRKKKDVKRTKDTKIANCPGAESNIKAQRAVGNSAKKGGPDRPDTKEQGSSSRDLATLKDQSDCKDSPQNRTGSELLSYNLLDCSDGVNSIISGQKVYQCTSKNSVSPWASLKY